MGVPRINRAERGLYHLKTVRFTFRKTEFGNTIKYKQKPNVSWVWLYSEILDKRLRIKCSSTALKWIDFMGGLDNYILKSPLKYVQSDFANKLREKLLRGLGVETEQMRLKREERETAEQRAKLVAERQERLAMIKREFMRIPQELIERSEALKRRSIFTKLYHQIIKTFTNLIPFSHSK